jgi:putative two-component system response regulator
MRTHAAIGAQAIERAEAEVGREVDFLNYAKQIAHWHHERWDGTGYPDRLAGEAIPLAARLMALADVFDALISRRVYKEPMAPEKARAIMAEQRGIHFDPDLIDLFLQGFDAFVEIATRHTDDAHEVESKAAGLRLLSGSA